MPGFIPAFFIPKWIVTSQTGQFRPAGISSIVAATFCRGFNWRLICIKY
jgi:hypothetical protein